MNVIREAAARLPGKWHKGSLYGPDDTACGLGHVIKVASENSTDMPKIVFLPPEITDIMNKVALEQYPDRAIRNDVLPHPFAQFNDHDDTTEDEVVAVMEKAAILLDEEI